MSNTNHQISNELAGCIDHTLLGAAATREQKVFACRIAQEACVDFIKTSTGLHPAGGATVEDIVLMKETAPNCRIKAAGGIKTVKQVLEMLEVGAERIGDSSSVQIINEFRAERLNDDTNSRQNG